MKYLMTLIIAFYICGIDVSAREPPPPPPAPLIYKAPEKIGLKEFISEDKTFQITFAGVPKITKQALEKGSLTSYRVYKQGSNSIVNIIELNSSLEKLEKNKEAFYDSIKSGFLKVPKAKIELEEDVQIAGKFGKEFSILQDYQYVKIRMFIAGNRIYQIQSDVTNWHIIGDKTKKAYQDETRRFFDSFKIINDK